MEEGAPTGIHLEQCLQPQTCRQLLKRCTWRLPKACTTPTGTWAEREPPLLPGPFTNVTAHQVTGPLGQCLS